MKQENYLNFGPGKNSTTVYRIISTKILYEFFDQRENTLVRPSKWEDPFENFILKSLVRLNDGTIANFSFPDSFYAQCWTLNQASDAMWRIYSPQSTGVRIKTSVRKLATSLSKSVGEHAEIQTFIGKVRYLSQKQLMTFANSVFQNGLNPTAFAHTLLVKRKAFVHEKEVRLIYMALDKGPKGDLFRHWVNPHDLIEQIMVDPRLSKVHAEKVMSEVKDRTGFQGPIKRSLLYAPPEGMIFPVG